MIDSPSDLFRTILGHPNTTPEDIQRINQTIVNLLEEINNRTKDSINKSDPERKVSFEEATEIMGNTMDLCLERDRAVDSAKKWNLLDILIKQKVIANEEEYIRCFNSGFTFLELIKARNYIMGGGKLILIFNPGVLRPRKLFETLFKGIATMDGDDVIALDDFRQINPEDPETIELLHLIKSESLKTGSLDHNDMFRLYERLYARAKRPTNSEPKIIFTPDEIEIGKIKANPIEDILNAPQNKITFIDPTSDFFRIRKQWDDAFIKFFGINPEIFAQMTNKEYQKKFRQFRKYTSALHLGHDTLGKQEYRKRFGGNVDMKSFNTSILLPDSDSFTYYPNSINETGDILVSYTGEDYFRDSYDVRTTVQLTSQPIIDTQKISNYRLQL